MAIKNAQIISERFLMKYLTLIGITSKNAIYNDKDMHDFIQENQ